MEFGMLAFCPRFPLSLLIGMGFVPIMVLMSGFGRHFHLIELTTCLRRWSEERKGIGELCSRFVYRVLLLGCRGRMLKADDVGSGHFQLHGNLFTLDGDI